MNDKDDSRIKFKHIRQVQVTTNWDTDGKLMGRNLSYSTTNSKFITIDEHLGRIEEDYNHNKHFHLIKENPSMILKRYVPEEVKDNSTILTNNGKYVNTAYPEQDTFDIRDIAHALSMICRFNGHCNEFYSVAEHSLRVSEILPLELKLLGLLHDASEAYICDIPKPFKRLLDDYSLYERRMQNSIIDAFGISHLMNDEYFIKLKEADNILLVTEQRDLMGNDDDWGYGVKPLPDKIEPLSQKEAKRKFLETFNALKTIKDI